MNIVNKFRAGASKQSPFNSGNSSSSGTGIDTAVAVRPMAMRHLKPLLKQLLQAVAECHTRGILHRYLSIWDIFTF